jgi:hypothetical protein
VCAVIFQLVYTINGNMEVAVISNALFVAGLLLICAAIAVSICFAVARKGEIAKGIGFGICIAFTISIVELALLECISGV